MITFLTASVLLALAPGPDNIFVLKQSALRGMLAGIVVMLGLCTGLIVHTSAVALGVAVIFLEKRRDCKGAGQGNIYKAKNQQDVKPAYFFLKGRGRRDSNSRPPA